MFQPSTALRYSAIADAFPRAHLVTFQGTDSDLAPARDHLISALIGKGCAVHVEEGSAHAIRVVLPEGGAAVLSVGRGVGDADACGLAAGLAVTDPGRCSVGELNGILTALDGLPLTGWEVAQVAKQLPVTGRLAERTSPDAFAGLAVLCAIHHMRDFTVMMNALIGCGADPALVTIIEKGYPYRGRDRVDGWLRHTLGATVVPYPARAAGIAAHMDRAARNRASTLVFDDGGYVLPVVLDHFPERAGEIIGVVEQTMSGIWKIEPYGDLPVPVFSVAESTLKAAVEAPYVASAAVGAVMEHLGDEVWAGRSALVLGYGRIGRQAARILRDVHRMRVAVHDRDRVALVTAQIDGFTVSRDLGALIGSHRPLLVLGGAGRGSLAAEHATLFIRPAYLASMTSRDYEFPLADWARLADRVVDYGVLGHGYLMPGGIELCVVADGLPVNFHHRESVPNRVIDLVFAALLLGGATLAAPGHGGHGPGRDVAFVDQILTASPALDAYLELYGGTETDRSLLTPAPEHCPDFTRSPWRYSAP